MRVLAWAGAPLPLFHPDRGEVRQACHELAGGTRISMALDSHERPFHCHHEKLVVVDDETAFVGGIDLTALSGDRLDWNEHPPRDGLGWHDTAVRLEGPVVGDVARHFRARWHRVAGDGLPEPGVAGRAGRRGRGAIRADACRPGSMSRGATASGRSSRATCARCVRPRGSCTSRVSSSGRRRSLDVLAEKLRRPPCDDFRVIVLLPARPNNGADDSRGQIGILIDADKESGDDTTRFLACTLYQPGPGGNPVYVHSKAAVVDDAWLTVGSANLNEHSLFNDTEANIVVRDTALAREVRLRLWEEHLERPRRRDRRRSRARVRRAVEAAGGEAAGAAQARRLGRTGS